MSDLVAAVFIIAALTVLIFLLGRRLGRIGHGVPETSALLAIVAVFAMRRWQDTPEMAGLMPVSSAIVLSNPLPLLAGLLAGLFCGRPGGALWRKTLVAFTLIGAAFVGTLRPLWPDRPEGGDLWTQGVCLQTAPSSCSAAAAATLLAQHRITATEAEMIDLCLTRHHGTPFLGLYRGLLLKTADTSWRVVPFVATIEQLRREKRPVILRVLLEEGADVDPRYANEWGWIPGLPHTVVLLGFDADGQPIVGDPGIGREHWDIRALRLLWTGWGMRLEERG